MASPSLRASDAWRLLLRCGVLALPLTILGVVYLTLDPFMVLRHHGDYYPGASGVFPNRDWVSSRVLLTKPVAERPNAFIFGNSRSMAFETADWIRVLRRSQKIAEGEEVRPYHFDASLESLYGVWSKIRYLDSHEYRLRHVLIVTDADLLRQAEHGDQRALFRKTPAIDGSSVLSFHLAFFEAFLSRGFFIKYCHFVWSGQARPYMAGVIEERALDHEPQTNDLSFRPIEDLIADSGEDFYRARSHLFDAPIADAGTMSPPVLGEPHRALLRELKAIFGKQGTVLRLVVSPLYDRRALAASDRAALEQIYGRAAVLDYSGPNDITRDRHNYYEESHYRIAVARRILDAAYPDPP